MLASLLITQINAELSTYDESSLRSRACVLDESDNTTCTFNDYTDPFQLIRKLNHLENSQTSIKKLQFVDCFIENIPLEVFHTFPNVEILDVSDSNLERIESYDFQQNKLITINASLNHISKLGARIVSKSNNLEALDLSHNAISRLNPSAFIYNPKFKFLNLSHNQITRLDIKFIAPLRSLQVLKLDHNRIQEISGDFSSIQLNWKELHMQFNLLKTLDPSLVRSVSILDISSNIISVAELQNANMTELRVHSNNLTSLALCRSLEKLDASSNSLNSFHLSFEDNQSLKFLDLSGTTLKSAKKTFNHLKNLKHLTYLDLSFNQIELNGATFEGLKELETLKLSFVEDLSEETLIKALQHLRSLTTLDLSNNSFLRRFDLRSFSELKNLASLDLKYNCLEEIIGWRNISSFLPNLKEINLYKNKFKCDEFSQMINEFERIGMKIVGLDDFGEEDYTSSCDDNDFLQPISKHDNQSENDNLFGVNEKILWALVAAVLVAIFVGGCCYLNRRFDIVSSLYVRYHRGVLLGDDK